ncbi:MAG: hypothetical protein ACP5IA_03360 [Sediminispirochaetaceae bacterium]
MGGMRILRGAALEKSRLRSRLGSRSRLALSTFSAGVLAAVFGMLYSSGCVFPLKDLLLDQSEALDQILSRQAVYVSRTHSGEEFGSPSEPYNDIGPALELAAELISKGSADTLEVRVAAGTYHPGSTLRLTPGVSLRGGYSYPLWDHDPETCETGIYGQHDPVISFDPGCRRSTAVQDLVIEAAAVNELCAIECEGAAPVIRGNTIDLRPVWDTSVGLLLSSDDALIDSNRIFVGSVTGNSWAVAAIASEAVIRNNVMAAESGSGTCIILHATQNADLDILNNTMYLSGTGLSDSVVFLSASTLRFENNILGAGSDCRGIYESTSGSPSFSSLKNNEFFHTADPLLRAEDEIEITSIPDMEEYIDTSAGAGTASGNDAGTVPLFTDPAGDDYHITSNPMDGIDLSAEFQHDADGNTRTVLWSIGAYELD